MCWKSSRLIFLLFPFFCAAEKPNTSPATRACDGGGAAAGGGTTGAKRNADAAMDAAEGVAVGVAVAELDDAVVAEAPE